MIDKTAEDKLMMHYLLICLCSVSHSSLPLPLWWNSQCLTPAPATNQWQCAWSKSGTHPEQNIRLRIKYLDGAEEDSRARTEQNGSRRKCCRREQRGRGMSWLLLSNLPLLVVYLMWAHICSLNRFLLMSATSYFLSPSSFEHISIFLYSLFISLTNVRHLSIP